MEGACARRTTSGIDSIATACAHGRRALRAIRSRCVAGATPRDAVHAATDALAHATDLVLGQVTVSVNAEAANAPPGTRPFEPGDLVTVDAPLCWRGWWSDQARSFVIERPSAATQPAVHILTLTDRRRLVRAARRVTACCIARCGPGVRWRDVRIAGWAEANRLGFRICRGLAGHGIGRSMHEQPVLGYHSGPWDGVILEPGMVCTVEPVLTSGSGATVTGPAGITVLTADGCDAACDERTIAVTVRGCRVL